VVVTEGLTDPRALEDAAAVANVEGDFVPHDDAIAERVV
jgi:hypothetical protein